MVELRKKTYICDVTFLCTTSFWHFISNIATCALREYTGHQVNFLFGPVNQGIFKTCESLVSCTIWTWYYTNKYNVHLYHSSMAVTSRLRELNKRGTIAHNIANLFYDQVRYTAWFFFVEIFFFFFIIEVISCSNISACLFLKIFFVLEYKCMHLF